MWAVVVVVVNKLGKDQPQVALAKGNRWSRHSRRAVLTQRSAIAFAFGAWIGVRKLAMPRRELRSTKSAPQTRSRSWIRKSGWRLQGVVSIS
jgi:ABC-type hemin transport system ATPase subunit